MTATQANQAKDSSSSRLIETIENAEHASLEAVRRFVDSVNDAFPDLGEDGPRHKIIDSAFKMAEQMVNASNRLAENILGVTEKALRQSDGSSSSGAK
ncbi:MAG TPA: hypothetical protein VMU77_06585 [Acidimicrobiales bacterium]|nr:hypothetical protein [Acidimicrobiales bacterium]